MNRQAISMTRDGKATTTKTTFSRETSVSTTINADPSIVWALLTNAADIPRWNSTVTSIKGNIREGETIELKSTLDEKRTFKLKVRNFSRGNGSSGVMPRAAACTPLTKAQGVASSLP